MSWFVVCLFVDMLYAFVIVYDCRFTRIEFDQTVVLTMYYI